MHYLEDSNGLSRDFPYDKNLPEDHKAYILRDLFVELHNISMARYNAFMSSSLYSENQIMPVPVQLKKRLFMQSLGVNRWEAVEQHERIDAIALYEAQTALQEKEYQACVDAFMSCNLLSKEWRMPVPEEVRDKIITHYAQGRIVDPLQGARESAFGTHKKIMIPP
jgi:hypothetical protein